MASAGDQECVMPGTCHWGAGQVALVTGAAKRVGKKIAAALHKHGYKVAIHYNTSKDQAIAFTAELNSIRQESAFNIQSDLSSAEVEASHQLVAAVVQKWGRLDLLVNNAACYFPTPLDAATEEQWNQLMDCNLKAPYFLIQAAASHLRKARGSVVNVADILGERPSASFSIYCITKAALIMATKSLALELGPEVRINYVNPGAAIWPEDVDKEFKQAWLSKTPLGRTGTGDEVADAVVYFASPSAGYSTGTGLNVCGGRSIAL